MLTEVFLLIVILALVGFIAFKEHSDKRERAKLLNAILAKNNTEFTQLEMVDKIPAPKTEIVEPTSDLQESELSDEKFMELIKEGSN